ncbi:MAG: hypothetical protein AAFV80_04945 [Bacteroidota bacterium]
MKGLLHTLIFVLFAGQVWSQAERAFVKSFPLNGDHAVVVQLDGEITIQKWDDDFVRVQTNIHIPNTNDNTLKALISAGRYRVDANHDGGALLLSSKDRSQAVTIRGAQLDEVVSYTIYVPEKLNVEIATPGGTPGTASLDK